MSERKSYPLRDYRERHGLSREALARLLSQKLGREIKPGGVQRYENYTRLPSSWVSALGLPAQTEEERTPPPEPAFVDAESWDATGSRDARSEETGSPGGGEWSAPSPPPVIYPHAQERLAQLHAAVGAGLSMATRNQGYSVVFATYGQNLAQQWVEAAKVDPNARRVVEFMESGGAVGGLVVGYVTLALACVYVSGRAEQLGFLFGGWQPFHDAARARPAAAAAAGANGRAGGPDPWSPEGWLGENPEPPEGDVEAGGARDDHRTDGLG